MKQFIFSLLMLLCITPASAQHRRQAWTNDSINLWLDTEGHHINAHGGNIIRIDSLWYWYGENRPLQGFSTEVGVEVYTSPDLEHWTDRGVALAVSEDPESPIQRGCIMERPKVQYNPRTHQYVMIFHLELKGQGYKAAQAGFAVSDTPLGPFKFLRSLRPNGEMSRDMTVYIDSDGIAYQITSSEENMTLHFNELSEDWLSFTGRYWRVAAGEQNEAPTIMKHEGKYWLICSGCTGWTPNQARMYVADKITGPWQRLESPMVGPGADKTFGAQGTYILETDKGPIFMADIWKPRHLALSSHLWIPIHFDEKGTPVIRKDR